MKYLLLIIILALLSSHIFAQKLSPNTAQKLEKLPAVYNPNSNQDNLSKTDVDWAAFDYTKINGVYFSEEIGEKIEIKYKEGKIYHIIGNDRTLKCELVLPDLMILYSYEIRALNDDLGEVSALLFSSDRVKDIRFERMEEY